VNRNDLRPIIKLAQAIEAKTFFEFGTYDGSTVVHFAEYVPSLKILYTLDLDNVSSKNVLERMSKDKDKRGKDKIDKSLSYVKKRLYRSCEPKIKNKIIPLFGDSTTFNFTKFSGIDVVFIDGGHTLQVVRSDTRNAIRMLSRTGCVVWHDYGNWNYQDLKEYLNSLADVVPIRHIYGTQYCYLMRKDGEFVAETPWHRTLPL
jgi:predicted O-methyltransferase YrrM